MMIAALAMAAAPTPPAFAQDALDGIDMTSEAFTKAEMTRSAKEDPRAPGGVFERVGGLLSDLLDQR